MVFSAFIDFIGRMPFHQLLVVTLVGVSSGVYIFRPLLERYANEHGLKNKQEEHRSNANAATTVVHEGESSTPEQKQEDAQRKGNAGSTSGN